jgi:hypothetical protein
MVATRKLSCRLQFYGNKHREFCAKTDYTHWISLSSLDMPPLCPPEDRPSLIHVAIIIFCFGEHVISYWFISRYVPLPLAGNPCPLPVVVARLLLPKPKSRIPTCPHFHTILRSFVPIVLTVEFFLIYFESRGSNYIRTSVVIQDTWMCHCAMKLCADKHNINGICTWITSSC